MIDIIVPVLSRPQNAQPLVDSIKANTTVEYDLHFVCSPDDDEQIDACIKATGWTLDILAVDWQPGPGDAAKKWNYGYKITDFGPDNPKTYPYVFMAADDITFTPGWDVEVLKVAERTGAGMVGTNDQANPLVMRGRHSTHSLFSRAYINSVGGTFFDGPGVVYCESYDHQYIDLEAVKAAMDRGQWAFAMNSVVAHHHPIYDRTVAYDDTYRKALGDASADKRLYTERLKEWSASRR